MEYFKCDVNAQKESVIKIWHMCKLIIQDNLVSNDEELLLEMTNEMVLSIYDTILDSIKQNKPSYNVTLRSPVDLPKENFGWAIKVDVSNRIYMKIEVNINQEKIHRIYGEKSQWGTIFEK